MRMTIRFDVLLSGKEKAAAFNEAIEAHKKKFGTAPDSIETFSDESIGGGVIVEFNGVPMLKLNLDIWQKIKSGEFHKVDTRKPNFEP